MFGNWKLGSRIGMGFGLLIIVAVGLGGLGAWRMNHEAQAVILLSNELVPEVQVTNELERSAMLAMYNLRGYALSENEQYLQEGSKHLKAVGEQLTKASELADHAATLSVLSAAAKSGRTSVDEYVKLTAATTDNFKAMTADRESMDEAAKRYMDTCEAYRSGQHQEVKNDLKVGVNAAQMTARMEKIGLAEEITALGFITRLAVWRAQAEREPEKLQQALRHFDTIATKISDAQALTKQEVHAKELLQRETAGLAYKQAVESLHTNMLVAQGLTRRRQAAGDQVVATAKSSASEGLNETDRRWER
jgi:methyl-accepting chemotaxis protein